VDFRGWALGKQKWDKSGENASKGGEKYRGESLGKVLKFTAAFPGGKVIY